MDADSTTDPLYVSCSDSGEESAAVAPNQTRQGRKARSKARPTRRTRQTSLSSTDRRATLRESAAYTPPDAQLVLRLYNEVGKRGYLDLDCKCAGEEARKNRREAEAASARSSAATSNDAEGDDDQASEDAPKRTTRRCHVRGQRSSDRTPYVVRITLIDGFCVRIISIVLWLHTKWSLNFVRRTCTFLCLKLCSLIRL